MTAAHLLAALILTGGSPLHDGNAWDGVSLRTVTDETARVTLVVPLTGALLETHHFTDAKAGAQMRHVFTLSSLRGEAVELGVFENPEGLDLDAFLAEHLAFFRLAEHTELPWTATKQRVKAVLFEHPRTSQQYARRAAVFAVGRRVFVLSCRNLEDRFAAGAFAALLSELEVKE